MITAVVVLLTTSRLLEASVVKLTVVSVVKPPLVPALLISVVAELLVVFIPKTAVKQCGEFMLTVNDEASTTTEPSSTQCMKTQSGLNTVASAWTDVPSSYQPPVEDGVRETVPASDGVESTSKRTWVT